MSFAATYAGQIGDVSAKLDRDDGSPFTHGGKLGALTRQYLRDVAEMCPDDKSVIVEASGHGDTSTVSLNLRVVTVHT